MPQKDAIKMKIRMVRLFKCLAPCCRWINSRFFRLLPPIQDTFCFLKDFSIFCLFLYHFLKIEIIFHFFYIFSKKLVFLILFFIFSLSLFTWIEFTTQKKWNKITWWKLENQSTSKWKEDKTEKMSWKPVYKNTREKALFKIFNKKTRKEFSFIFLLFFLIFLLFFSLPFILNKLQRNRENRETIYKS